MRGDSLSAGLRDVRLSRTLHIAKRPRAPFGARDRSDAAISRVLFRGRFADALASTDTCPRWRPFLWAQRCRGAQAIYPHPTCPDRTPPVLRPERMLLDLARTGVCHAPTLTGRAVRSCRTFSPLPEPPLRTAIGGSFSVALSRARGGWRFSAACRTGGRYPPACPAVLGLSSGPGPSQPRGRLPRLTESYGCEAVHSMTGISTHSPPLAIDSFPACMTATFSTMSRSETGGSPPSKNFTIPATRRP